MGRVIGRCAIAVSTFDQPMNEILLRGDGYVECWFYLIGFILSHPPVRLGQAQR
jgi:hypothetical protein